MGLLLYEEAVEVDSMFANAVKSKATLVDRNLINGCVVLQYPAYVVSFLLIATCKIMSWRSKRGLRMLHTHSDYLGNKRG